MGISESRCIQSYMVSDSSTSPDVDKADGLGARTSVTDAHVFSLESVPS